MHASQLNIDSLWH